MRTKKNSACIEETNFNRNSQFSAPLWRYLAGPSENIYLAVFSNLPRQCGLCGTSSQQPWCPAAARTAKPRWGNELGTGTLGARREEEGRVGRDNKAGRVDIEIMLKVIVYVYNIKLVLRRRSFMHIPKAWKGEN